VVGMGMGARSSAAQGRLIAAATPPWKHASWMLRDGTPTPVLAIAQSTDGTLWIGTPTGLYQFDGVRFQEYTPSAAPGMLERSIAALRALPDGSLWIGYSHGGASRLQGDRLQNYGDREGIPRGSINAFARDSAGVIWVATTSGLARLVDGHWQRIETGSGFPGGMTTDLLVDRRGTLWAAQSSGVFTLRRGSARFSYVAPSLDRPPGGFGMLREAPEGTIWGASMTLGLTRLADSAGGAPAEPDYPFRDPGSYGMIIDHQSNAWVMGVHGLVCIPLGALNAKRGAFTLSSRQRPLLDGVSMPRSVVTAVFEDEEGSIWVGTDRGLEQFRPPRVVSLRVPERIYLPALAADSGGRVWAGSTSGPLTLITGDPRAYKDVPAGIQSAYRDFDGTLWFGGPPGVWRSRNGAFEKVELPPEAARGDVQAISHALNGDLWLAIRTSATRGVFRRQRGAWQRFQAPAEVPEELPSVIASDSAGRTWLGYASDRLVRVTAGSVHVFSSADGLDVGSITAICIRGDHVWVGGTTGVAHFDGVHFRSLSATSGPLRGVTGIVEPASGELWLNGADGITRIAATELYRAARTPDYVVRDERLDFRDGLEGSAPQLRSFPSAIEGTDGRLWFTTETSVAWIDPARITRNTVRPPVQIRWIDAGSRRYTPTQKLVLPPHTTELHIAYTAFSLAVPDRVRFRYRLVGSDTGWRDADTRREAFYTNLGPGAYRFHVIAANDDGVWNDAGASVDVDIPAAFMQTNTFRFLCAAVAAAAMWLLMLWRQRLAMHAIQARFEVTLAERIRIAQGLHDTLLQGLTGITYQMHAVRAMFASRPTEALHLLANAESTADATLRDARQMLWEMRVPELDARDLPDALEAAAREVLGQSSIALTVAVRGERRRLPAQIEATAFRIGREAVVNVVRHSDAQMVEIALAFGPHALEMRIRDDGRGVHAADIANASRSGHWGIVGMRERAAGVGGSMEIAPGAEGGSEVIAVLPTDGALG
jgi:signal transduction histidine kinase/ligand-binding sensor domain-containing protein